MSTTQGSTTLCTPTSWSRTGQTPPCLHREGEGVCWLQPNSPSRTPAPKSIYLNKVLKAEV